MRKLSFLFILSTLGLKPVSAQNTDGDAFFNHSNVHEIYITFHQSSFWDSLVAGYAGDYYIKGDVEIDGTLMLECGVKLKGNSSYNNPSIKKSIKLDFNNWVSGQDYDGLKKINLNNGFKDPTLMREKLMLDFLRENNAYAPRCHYANVYLNGTYWGLYTTVEEIDKTFLEYNFDDKKGNLFKGDPTGDLRWINSSQSSYETKYELKTNETENDWTDLIAFINTLNNTPTNLDQSLDTIFDSENYMLSWATHILFSNLDSYQGSGHNYYVYFDSTALKFRFITWDVNEAFGVFTQGMNVTQLEQLSYSYVQNPNSRPLTEKLLANTNYTNQYIQRLCDLLQYNFSNLALDGKIDSIANVIRTHVYADPNKFFSNQDFENNLSSDVVQSSGPGTFTYPGLKSFITNRRNSLSQQLSAFCTVGISEEIDISSDNIYPNPAINQITYDNNNKMNNYTIADITGKICQEGNLQNGKNEINLSTLPKGIYFFNVQNGNIGVTKTEKLIKL